MVVILLLQGSSLLPPAPDGQERPAELPYPFPAYSHLASTVEDTPPGPALLALTHGLDVEFLDAHQAVVLGCDGTTYRHPQTPGEAWDVFSERDPRRTVPPVSWRTRASHQGWCPDR